MRANLLHVAFQVTLGIVFGLALTSRPALADTKLVVGKANANADNTIPVNVGDQRGFFQKRGLDLEIVDFQGGSKMIQGMIAGNIDIAVGAGVEMSFIARGTPMMAVCETASTIPFLSVGIPWNSPIRSLKDLKGKKIGVSSSGSLTDWLAKQLAVKQGWGIDGVQRAPIGGSPPASMAAFKAGLIDADIGGTATFLRMAESKVGKVLAPASSYMGHIASGVIYASNKLIEANPNAVRAFVAGWLDTIRYMRTHKAETVKIEMSVTKYSEAVTSQEYDFVIGMYTNDCKFDAASLETLKQSFIDLKLLNEAPDMSKLYTEAYLPK